MYICEILSLFPEDHIENVTGEPVFDPDLKNSDFLGNSFQKIEGF